MNCKSFLLTLVLVVTVSLAIQPVSDYDIRVWGKYEPTAHIFTTEGGNITNVNINQNVSTEKWAGIFGNITGTVRLSDGTNDFYTWSWSPSSGGWICAQANDTAEFDWVNLTAAVKGDIDTAWGFDTDDTDSATNTFNESCDGEIAGKSFSSAAAVTAGNNGVGTEAKTCVLKDKGTISSNEKEDLAFCTVITDAGYDVVGVKADYALLIPTEETVGATETYILWLELS